MVRYVLKRILSILPIVFGVTLITFSIMSFTPGDPARIILGTSATQNAIDNLNHQLGYDKPFFIQFFNYVINAVTKLDFGNSYLSQKPVFDDIMLRFPTTLTLAFLSVAVAATIGIPIGIYSAVKQYSITDTVTTFMAMFFAAVPGFWLGMMFILLFSLQLRLLPSNGIESWKGFILPVITLALPPGSELMRITRTTMLETIRQDYIRTARAKGAPERTVVFKHALRNALLPVITQMGVTFAMMLGGTIIIESVFGLPGIGSLIVNAIKMKDIPLVLASTIFLATIFCIIMIIIDILYGFVDPRVKARFSR